MIQAPSPNAIAAGALHVPAAIRLPAADIFAVRASRLRRLADGHAWADFLIFAADLADAQQRLLDCLPPAEADPEKIARGRRHGMPLLDAQGAGFGSEGRDILDRLLATACAWSPTVAAIASKIRAGAPEAQQDLVRRILRAEAADPAAAPLVAAALQVDWVRQARALTTADVQAGPETGLCPVCGSHPAASIVRIGDAGHGVRYAACSLCGTEWHVVRIKCVPCQSTKGVAYLGLENGDGPVHPAVKVETCDACHSSLKIVSMEKDPMVDPFADDLATLALDMLADEAGYHRAGRNLFYFVT